MTNRKLLSHIFQTLCLGILCLALVLAGCTRSEKTAPGERADDTGTVLAEVDGEPITRADVLRRMKPLHGNTDESKMDPNERRMIMKSVTEEEIRDRLLLKAALSQGMHVTPEEIERGLRRSRKLLGDEAYQEMLNKKDFAGQDYKAFLKKRILIRKIKKQLFDEITIEEQRLLQYYDEHKENLVAPESVRIGIIMAESPEEGETFHRRLSQGEDLGELVEEYSALHQKRVGGKMKWLPYEAITEDFRQLVRQGKTGELLGPLEVPEGFAVVKILEKRSAGTPTFDEIKSDMEQALRSEEEQKVLDRWYKAQKQKVKIEYMN